jgi:hypothetical protein
MVMSPTALGNQNVCAGEGQQQFTKPDRGRGPYEILNKRLFNFPDSSHRNSVFSLYFPLKAEINTIKSLIIKHDCNANRPIFMRFGHMFLAQIDKCHCGTR